MLRLTPEEIRSGWVRAERCPRCLDWHGAAGSCGEVTVALKQIRCRRCGALHCVREGFPWTEPLCPACEPPVHPLTFAERDERGG
jgi:hypothetical protein